MSKRIRHYSEYEMSDRDYEDYLDEIFGDVEVCGYSYSSGRVLHELDPIAFDCGKSELMQWRCDNCGKIYDEESDADECCPEYQCENCKELYFDEDQANECEESHVGLDEDEED